MTIINKFDIPNPKRKCYSKYENEFVFMIKQGSFSCGEVKVVFIRYKQKSC